MLDDAAALTKLCPCVQDKRSIDPSKPNNKDRYTSSIPGPDQYMTREKIGRTKPAISFTRDTKEHAPYVSLSKEGADALLKGYLSPGPAYGALPSVGVQLETGKRNASIARFPKASRFPKSIREDTPGPGSYVT